AWDGPLTYPTINSVVSMTTGERNISTAPSLKLLLRAAAEDRTDLALGDFRAEQIRWAVDSGLGPLLRRATTSDLDARKSPLWPLVESPDLTARVRAGEGRDAAAELIRACEGRTPPLTLLKGISICEQVYPEPHLRFMGDIDVLAESTGA